MSREPRSSGMLAYYSDYPSSNPTEYDNFSEKLYLKNGNKQEEAGDGPFLKTHEDISLKAAAAAANLSTLFTVRRT